MYNDQNPKTPFGMKKPSLWNVPFTAVFHASLAHLHGALKYGRFNWRKDPVSASTYIDAAMRHINEWKEGAQIASDSGVHHLAHAIACLNIIIDAQEHETLIDDRNCGHLVLDQDAFYERLKPTIDRLYAEWGNTAKKDNADG